MLNDILKGARIRSHDIPVVVPVRGRQKCRPSLSAPRHARGLAPFTAALLSVGIFTGLSNGIAAEEPAAPKAEVVWQQIGEAPGVVGMAATGGKLFAATAANKLHVCDPAAAPLASC